MFVWDITSFLISAMPYKFCFIAIVFWATKYLTAKYLQTIMNYVYNDDYKNYEAWE